MPSVKKNYLYNLTAQLLTIILPLITMPYISRVLGEDNIGIFEYAQSIVNYFILFGSIGISLYGQRETAFNKDKPQEKSCIFFELILIRFVTVSASIIIFILLIVRNADYPSYYLLLGIELVASLFDINWFFQGNENFKIQAMRTIFIRILSLICIFIFVKDENDLGIYTLCYASAIFIANISVWFRLKGELVKVSFKLLRPLRHIKPVLIIFLPQIATSIYTQLDKTMIGIFTDYNYAEVSFYSQAERVVKIAMTVITSTGAIMLSRIAAVFSENNPEKIKNYITKSFRFMFLLAMPITAGLMIVAQDLVPWFFGPGYEKVIPCMIALSPLIVIIGISNILGTQYLIPTRQMNKYTFSIVMGMLCNFLFNFLLIEKYASLGAVAATLISECAVTLTQFIFVRDSISPKILLACRKNLLSALIMSLAVYITASFLPSEFLSSIIEIAVGVFVYFLVLWLLRDSFFRELIERCLPSPLKKRLGWLYKR